MASILLICNKSNEVISFRKELIIFLTKKMHKVFVIASDDTRAQDIESLGATFICTKYNNRSKNFFSFRVLKNRFYKVIKTINPDIVFTFQAKPNVFGSSACKKAKCKNVYCMVEGLGEVFSNQKGIKNKLLIKAMCVLYKRAFKYAKKVFFLNQDDIEEMIHKYHTLTDEKAVLIHSIGIDTKQYLPVKELPENKNVVLLSRLLINKGIYDYCQVASLVKSKRSDITFHLYGEESQIKKEDLKQYIDDDIITYHGYTKDAKQVMSNASIIVSLSKYREGFPRILLEAMALAKPIIATNNVGNKDAVKDNENGYLVPIGSNKLFADKICSLIDDNRKMVMFGENGRKICEQYFDSNIINNQIYRILFDK